MAILKLLSEEIFDYSAEQMTQLKTTNLRQSICNEFSEIFKLCKEILEKATKPSLIKATLDTLLRFLSWIPLGYIFETDLLSLLEKVCIPVIDLLGPRLTLTIRSISFLNRKITATLP